MIRLGNRGETIVEILMVVVVLGSALATASLISNRSSSDTRSAQERSEASVYGQQKIERLKTLLAKNTVFPSNRFCIQNDNSVLQLNGADTFGCQEGRYSSAIIFDQTYGTYTQNVRWDSLQRNNDFVGKLTLVYRTEFLNDLAAILPAPTFTPAADLCPSAVPLGQMQVCYYNNTELEPQGFAFQEVRNTSQSPNAPNEFATDVVSDDYGVNSPNVLIDTDNFSGRWKGQFFFAAGTYNFTVRGDDGIRLFIGNNPVPVIDAWFEQDNRTHTSFYSIPVSGRQTVRLEFNEHAGFAAARLFWGPATVLPRTGLIWTNNGGSTAAATAASTGQNFCWKITESAEPPTFGWNNNYLCSNTDLGITWSESGAIAGKECVRWNVPHSGSSWTDNWLCSNDDLGLVFDANGPVPGLNCIALSEPNDSHPPGRWQSGNINLCETAAAPVYSEVVEAETFTIASGSVVNDGSASAGKNAYALSGGITKNISLNSFKSLTVRARGDSFRGSPNMIVAINGTPVFTGAVQNTSAYSDYVIGGLNYPAGSYDIRVSFDNDNCGSPPEEIPCAPGARPPYINDRNLIIDKLTFSNLNAASTTPVPVESTYSATVSFYRQYAYWCYVTCGYKHYITPSKPDNDRVLSAQEGTYEGISFYGLFNNLAGSLPVYRLRDNNSGAPYYTINTADRSSKISQGFDDLGAVARVYNTAGVNRTPVFYFYNSAQGDHFYTTNVSERDTVIANYPSYSYQGIVFYSINSPST